MLTRCSWPVRARQTTRSDGGTEIPTSSATSAARRPPACRLVHLACATTDASDKGYIAFYSSRVVVVVLLVSLVYFAYAGHVRVEHEPQRRVDLTCLARNIYFEARGEPVAGQHAVA